MTLTFGLIVNPLAGLGGAVALKGSDGVADLAIEKGAVSKVPDRLAAFFENLTSNQINWVVAPGVMGADYLGETDKVVVGDTGATTTGEDTRRIANEIIADGVDLLIFAGGDGTARDIVDAVNDCDDEPLVLGIPCGVKMHSGVFATSPDAAGQLLTGLLGGKILSVTGAEVRDIDEEALRRGEVKARFYGELAVPDDIRYLQQTKVGGVESDDLVREEIAADFTDYMDEDVLYLMGAGTTVASIMASLGIENTLLGVDAIRGGALVKSDLDESEILKLIVEAQAQIVVTFTGGQGYLFGRGNQQLSAAVLKRIGAQDINIVSTKAKLQALEGRPLLVDTGDRELDQQLAGMRRIKTGYEDEVVYLVEPA